MERGPGLTGNPARRAREPAEGGRTTGTGVNPAPVPERPPTRIAEDKGVQ